MNLCHIPTELMHARIVGTPKLLYLTIHWPSTEWDLEQNLNSFYEREDYTTGVELPMKKRRAVTVYQRPSH